MIFRDFILISAPANKPLAATILDYIYLINYYFFDWKNSPRNPPFGLLGNYFGFNFETGTNLIYGIENNKWKRNVAKYHAR